MYPPFENSTTRIAIIDAIENFSILTSPCLKNFPFNLVNASNSDLEHYSVLLTVDGDKLDYELQQIWSLIIDVSDGLNPSDSYR